MVSGRNRGADGTLTFIYSHTLTQLSRHASQTQFPVRGVGSARLILAEAQERGANATSASRNERPPGHRGAVGQGRPRLRRLGSGAPESGSHPLLGRPRVYPRYSLSVIFSTQTYRREMYQIATKGPEKQAVGRAGAGGQPAWLALPPGRQGPWPALQGPRPEATRRRVERVICSWT